MKFQLLYILPFLVLVSCCAPEKKSTGKKAVEVEPDYGILWIHISNRETKTEVKETIAIYDENDTSYCNYHKVIYDEEHFKANGIFPNEKDSFILSKEEKKEIYNCFQDIFNHSVAPQSTVSCYAGQFVTFTISGNPELSCRYSSVSDWQNISPSIKKVYDMTLKRIYETESD